MANMIDEMKALAEANKAGSIKGIAKALKDVMAAGMNREWADIYIQKNVKESLRAKVTAKLDA